MIRGIFVTGTDTGVGKTVVTAGLLRLARDTGLDAVPMKAVQTGAVERDGVLTAPDLDVCLQAAELEPSDKERKLMCPYMYKPACSPHLAGRLAGRCADPDVIAVRAMTLMKTHKAVIVEGSGGVFAPIDEQRTMLDVIKTLKLRVLIVSRNALGTLNHTLLTIEVLRRTGVDILGVVMNRTDPSEDESITTDNPNTIVTLSHVRMLGQIPFMDPIDLDSFRQGLTGFDEILEAMK